MIEQITYAVLAIGGLLGWSAAMASHFRLNELERRLSALDGAK